jgi:hypothetical protein
MGSRWRGLRDSPTLIPTGADLMTVVSNPICPAPTLGPVHARQALRDSHPSLRLDKRRRTGVEIRLSLYILLETGALAFERQSYTCTHHVVVVYCTSRLLLLPVRFPHGPYTAKSAGTTLLCCPHRPSAVSIPFSAQQLLWRANVPAISFILFPTWKQYRGNGGRYGVPELAYGIS